MHALALARGDGMHRLALAQRAAPPPSTPPTRLARPHAHSHWMHSESWWPRLLRQHGEIAWDDYEKDYSDLPAEVLTRHRWGCVRARKIGGRAGWGVPAVRWVLGWCTCESTRRRLTQLFPYLSPARRVAEAIKDTERQHECVERERREALQVRACMLAWGSLQRLSLRAHCKC